MLLKASQYLLTQTEAAFYKQLNKIKTDLYTPYILTLKREGALPEKAKVEYQFKRGSRLVERLPEGTDNSVKHVMTLNDYLRLEAPHTVQAVIQSKEGTKTIKKDFVMKQANQTIVFNTDVAEEEIVEEEKTSEDKENITTEEDLMDEENIDIEVEPWRKEYERIVKRITSPPECPSSGSEEVFIAWETQMWNWYNSMIAIIGVEEGRFTNPRVYQNTEYELLMESLLEMVNSEIDIIMGGR